MPFYFLAWQRRVFVRFSARWPGAVAVQHEGIANRREKESAVGFQLFLIFQFESAAVGIGGRWE